MFNDDTDNEAFFDEKEFPLESDMDDPSDSDDFVDDETTTRTVPCPGCGRDVYEDAERCPSCGDFVSRSSGSSHQPLWIIAGVVVCVVVVVLCFVL